MRVSGKKVLAASAGVVAATAYVWIAAVRAVPGVRRRKAADRARRKGATPG